MEQANWPHCGECSRAMKCTVKPNKEGILKRVWFCVCGHEIEEPIYGDEAKK